MKANITRPGGMMKPWLRMFVGAKTWHHIDPGGQQGLRQELKLRKPQAVSSRSPQVLRVREGSTLQTLEGNQWLWESFWHI